MVYKPFQGMEWVMKSAIALITAGMVLNFVVGQTLGSLSMASVILALYVEFWAFVLGSIALVVVAMWMLVRIWKPSLPEWKGVQPETPHQELSASMVSASSD